MNKCSECGASIELWGYCTNTYHCSIAKKIKFDENHCEFCQKKLRACEGWPSTIGSHKRICDSTDCDELCSQKYRGCKSDDIIVLFDRYNYAIKEYPLAAPPTIHRWDETQSISRRRKDFDFSRWNKRIAATI